MKQKASCQLLTLLLLKGRYKHHRRKTADVKHFIKILCVCFFLQNYKISVLTWVILRALSFKIILGLCYALFSLFTFIKTVIFISFKSPCISVIHCIKFYAWTGKTNTHTHYVSKLINQPLLKNFDKRGWKQMISKSSFPQVTLQYKFRIWAF